MKPSKIINVWCDPLRIRPPPNRQKLTKKSSKWAIFHPWNPSTFRQFQKDFFHTGWNCANKNMSRVLHLYICPVDFDFFFLSSQLVSSLFLSLLRCFVHTRSCNVRPPSISANRTNSVCMSITYVTLWASQIYMHTNFVRNTHTPMHYTNIHISPSIIWIGNSQCIVSIRIRGHIHFVLVLHLALKEWKIRISRWPYTCDFNDKIFDFHVLM